ncbi:hypothetical protein GCM10022600_27350 [Qipengyuania pelagi]|uniref:Uncharacterized protein n=1 Tax=Qipengyuania pelagi TaxID=994320 RepID=A0A844Y1Z8_9SPHN|nr:hypothetical protein [Qipengyuania pelagi]MXO52430.1 hypothetical protein [Qipengyuania pelagi]
MNSSGPQIGYSQLVKLLVTVFGVPEQGEKALRARLKNLQAKNFPPGVNLGRLGRVAYGPREVAMLGLVLSLTSSFVSPDVAVNTVLKEWKLLAEALREGARGKGRVGALATFRANALGSLGKGSKKQAPVMDVVIRWPDERKKGQPGPLILVDLDDLAERLVKGMSGVVDGLAENTPLFAELE